MACPSRTLRRHAFISLIVVSGFVAAPVFGAEIVKCITKDGTPLYQNFPCNVDSLGSLPWNPQAAANKSKDKSKSEAAKVISPVKTASASEPRIGMAADEVKTLWGEPEEMVEDEPRSGRVTVWRYADGRLVQFDHKHRVSDVQR